MVRRLREAGAIIVGLTHAAGAGDLRLHRVGDLRRHPQPLEPAAHPGRLQRRLRRGGRRRAGADRLGRRRRRLDPHPRRLLRPLRAEAPARPRLAGAGARRLERAGGRWLPQPLRCSTPRSGSTSSPAARRSRAPPPPPERPFVESAQTPPGKLRVAWSTVAAARRGAADRLATWSRTRSPTPPSCCARSATRSPSGTPTGARSATTSPPRFLRGVAEDRRRSAAPGAARTPHPRLRPARRSDPGGALRSRPAAAPPADAARVNAIFDDARRPDHAGDGRHGAAGPPLGGPRRPATRCWG